MGRDTDRHVRKLLHTPLLCKCQEVAGETQSRLTRKDDQNRRVTNADATVFLIYTNCRCKNRDGGIRLTQPTTRGSVWRWKTTLERLPSLKSGFPLKRRVVSTFIRCVGPMGFVVHIVGMTLPGIPPGVYNCAQNAVLRFRLPPARSFKMLGNHW